MKILFIPNDLGGGFGHVSRCLSLAEASTRRGHRALFALSGKYRSKITEAGYEVFTVPVPGAAPPGRAEGPAYLFLSGVAYQAVRDGFDNKGRVRHVLDALLSMISSMGPDLLVGDGHLLTWIAGRLSGIPVIQLVKSVVHPRPVKMTFWENDPEDLNPPDPRPVFNPLLRESGLPEIDRVEHLFDGDLLLIPGIADLDPMEPLPERTRYVGPLVRSAGLGSDLPGWLQTLPDNKPVIYVTIGGAAGPRAWNHFFHCVVKACREEDWTVVISTGGVPPALAAPPPDSIQFHQWVPGPEMIARSDLVLHHGGYSRIEVLLHGLPAVVIPFHSEQEYYGRILERAGVARLVPGSSGAYRMVTRRWKGGNRWLASKPYSVHFRPELTLNASTLGKAIAHTLEDADIRAAAVSMQARLSALDGCGTAVELMESVVSSR